MLDCTTACVIQSPVVPIATGKLLRAIRLPPYFRLTFDVQGPALANAGDVRSILDIRDDVADESVLAVATSETRNLVVVHNDVRISSPGGPMLVTGFTTLWTTVTIDVKPYAVSLFTSSQVLNVYDTAVNYDVQTRGKVFSVYTSNSHEMSSLGNIRNINITGNTTNLLTF